MPDILQTSNLIRIQAREVDPHQYVPLVDPDTETQYVVPAGHNLVLSGIFGSGKGAYFLRINGSIELTEAESRSQRMFKGLVLLAGDSLEVMYKNSKLKEDIIVCGELFLSA